MNQINCLQQAGVRGHQQLLPNENLHNSTIFGSTYAHAISLSWVIYFETSESDNGNQTTPSSNETSEGNRTEEEPAQNETGNQTIPVNQTSTANQTNETVTTENQTNQTTGEETGLGGTGQSGETPSGISLECSIQLEDVLLGADPCSYLPRYTRIGSYRGELGQSLIAPSLNETNETTAANETNQIPENATEVTNQTNASSSANQTNASSSSNQTVQNETQNQTSSLCSLGIVCDDLNTLKTDVDRFMSQASNDFAANYARHLQLSNRLDSIDVQLKQYTEFLTNHILYEHYILALIQDQLSRLNQSMQNASASVPANDTTNATADENDTLGLGILGVNSREQMFTYIQRFIVSRGLQVGANWRIKQVGDNLQIQNFFNSTSDNSTGNLGFLSQSSLIAESPDESSTANSGNEESLISGQSTSLGFSRYVLVSGQNVTL